MACAIDRRSEAPPNPRMQPTGRAGAWFRSGGPSGGAGEEA
jgi:hypothetical protein